MIFCKNLHHFVFFIICLYSFSTKGQSAELQARSAYLNAEQSYKQGKFSDALNFLKNARSTLGKSNSKIQYLMVKSLEEMNNYTEAKNELKTYFEVTPENINDDKYQEMLLEIAKVNNIIEQTIRRRSVVGNWSKPKERSNAIQAKDDFVLYDYFWVTNNETSYAPMRLGIPSKFTIESDEKNNLKLTNYSYYDGYHMEYSFSGKGTQCQPGISGICAYANGTLTFNSRNFPDAGQGNTDCIFYTNDDGSKLFIKLSIFTLKNRNKWKDDNRTQIFEFNRVD